MRTVNTYIGSPVERVEDERFLRGKGQYIDDVKCDGLWHAAFLRSPIGHARITRLDAAAALTMPGVRAVVTAEDMADGIPTIPFRRPNPTIGPYAQPVIAPGKVRYYGEPIAVVLADSPELAEDALAAIEVEFEPLAAVTDWASAKTGAVLLFETTESNIASVFQAEKGDPDKAFQEADFVVRDQFSTQRQTALPMETRGLLAEWDAVGKKLRVSGAAKLPFFNRRTMAKVMNLPEEAVDYIEVDVGGGFGARGEFYPEDFLVAFAARKFGHPVKWVEDRREHLTAIGHSRESLCDVEIALRKDGTLIGLRGEIYVNIGAYVRPNGMTPVRNLAQFMSGPYRIPNIHLLAHGYVTNKTPAGTYRGPGRYESCYFMERLMDLAAAKTGIDRLVLRRRNLVTNEEMPYALAPVLPSDGRADTSLDSGDHRTCFDRCVSEFDWAGKAHLQGRKIDGVYHGLGIACFVEGGASGPSEAARMQVEADGSVSVYAGSSAIGQGLETVLSQIAADALEISMDRIRLYHGSTNYLKEGWGSYGSRATVMGGNAVVDAATKLLERFRSAAAARLGLAPGEVTIADGVARAPDGRSVPLVEVAKDGIASEGKFNNATPTYTFGTAAVHVCVDVETGHVRVLDYLVVDDVGRVINPLTMHGQVMGAAVQGFGAVFSEELAYDAEGTPLFGTLADYVLPLATDYPHIHCVTLENYPSPTNPLGAKGAGEGGIIPVAGAVANAVAAALKSFGVEPRHLPLSPNRIWELVQEAKRLRTVAAE
jgi:carbon-monoxide dehydrogenase large subunit